MEVRVVEDDRREQVPARAHRDDPRVPGRGQRRVQPEGELEVTEVVGRELHLPALGSALQLGQRHDAGVVDQDVQSALPGGDEVADRLPVSQVESRHVDLGVAGRRSDGLARPRCPAARLRTARVTSAPIAAKARAVSMPMPDAPPVTTTRLPDRSMPSVTSAVVESNPNGVVKRLMRRPFVEAT